jgi:Mn2+/Fe2+ NRAMP family transporter
MIFFIVLFIFSLLIGVTITAISHILKQYLFKEESSFEKNIWIGAIVAIICFALGTFLFFGLSHTL